MFLIFVVLCLKGEKAVKTGSNIFKIQMSGTKDYEMDNGQRQKAIRFKIMHP